MIFTTLIEPRELHAFMLNQKSAETVTSSFLTVHAALPIRSSVSSFTPRSTFRAPYSLILTAMSPEK